MKIAIDFDGVICERTGIPTKKGLGKPMKGALDAIKLFKKLGHKVWVFTSNPEPQMVRMWLDKHNFPKIDVRNTKDPAHIYIDDRAVRFTNWQDIRKYIC